MHSNTFAASFNCGAEAFINTSALQHNIKQIRKVVGNVKILAMVKSNAYGHGLLPVAKALTEEADAFGVACIGEALILRKARIQNPIVALHGFSNIDELNASISLDLDYVIHDLTQLDILNQVALAKPIKVWLKIDTGMHRLGFLPDQVAYAYDQLVCNANVEKPFHLMTHLASADDFTKTTTVEQINLFKKLTNDMQGQRSIANSAGIFGNYAAFADWVRPGVILYGISPFSDKTGSDLGLHPAMTLATRLIAVKMVPKGGAIGYGGIWQAPDTMPVGIAAIGYGDGYPRYIKEGTPILVNRVKCQIVGRVSMDLIAVDLRNYPTAKCGDQVILWGPELPIEVIAQYANTSPYELLCGLTQRIRMS